MIQFDEHIFQMGWFNHQLVLQMLQEDVSWYAFGNASRPQQGFIAGKHPTSDVIPTALD